ncbi:hypothetical protein NDA16_002003 [Ustilago loliicola]|nr:hypothetical protein NDA16_002003 [Ustilago loliicola]
MHARCIRTTTAPNRSIHSACHWFIALGIGKGQRIPIQRTVLYSDTPEEKLAKIKSMAEHLSQEVAAAATGGAEDVRPAKRELDPSSATAAVAQGAATEANDADASAENATKRARFDNDTRETNKHGQKKWERRDRRGTGRAEESTSTSSTTASENAQSCSGSDRLPKRKVAVKFGYCGIGYSGLQINPGVKTIEGDIFSAFCTAGAVSADNAVNPNKVGLQRAARTDRGVHAAGNLLSLKLILEPAGLKQGETLVDKVNGLLPDFIRIWGITRVQNGFNARQSCDSRMYEYLLPTYVFIPPKPGSSMHDMLVRMQKEELEKLRSTNPDASTTSLDQIVNHPFWAEHGTTHDFSTDISAKKKYRLPPAHLARIRSIFARYSGSHNFHNFTVGKEFRDRSCQRFMKQLTISDPKLIKDVEWVSIKFHGQSFMLHQIRKMIGLLVLVGRTGAGEGLVDECFGPARVHIPKAPGLGLLLERPIFDAYNSRIRNSNDKVIKLIRKKGNSGVVAASEGNGGDETVETSKAAPANSTLGDKSSAGKPSPLSDELRESISYTPHESLMEIFKQRWIYDRIIATEEETNEFVVKVGEFHRDTLRHRKAQLDRKVGEGKDAEQAEISTEHDEDEEAYGKKGKELDEYEG